MRNVVQLTSGCFFQIGVMLFGLSTANVFADEASEPASHSETAVSEESTKKPAEESETKTESTSEHTTETITEKGVEPEESKAQESKTKEAAEPESVSEAESPPRKVASYSSTYVIEEQGLGLFRITEILYGNRVPYTTVARWNHLESPDSLPLGTSLVLKKHPKISIEQAHAKAREFMKEHPSQAVQTAQKPEGKSDAKAEVKTEAKAEESHIPATAPAPGIAGAEGADGAEKDAKTEGAPINQLAVDSANEEEIIYEGLLFNRNGKPQEAIKLYEKFSKEHPNSFHIIKAKGDSYLLMNDYDKSLSCFEEVVKDHPQDVEAWLKELIVLKKTNSDKRPALVAQFKKAFPQLQNLPTL